MALRRAATAATASSRKVLLLGWSGCQPRHLAKYEQMYAQLGYVSDPMMLARFDPAARRVGLDEAAPKKKRSS